MGELQAMRLKLTSEEVGCICLLLYFGTQGYVPILMPGMGAALTTAGQMSEQHGVNHVLLLIVWSGIFFAMLKSHFHIRLDLLSARVALGYCLFASCSTAWSSEPTSSLSAGVSLTISTIFAIFLCSRFSGERLLILLGWVVLILAAATAFFAVFIPGHGLDHLTHSGAWTGVFNQKNTLGQVMVFGTGIGLAQNAKNLSQQLFRYSIIFLSVAEVALSRSREAWLVCGAVLFFHFLFKAYMLFALSSRRTVLLIGGLCAIVSSSLLAALYAFLLKLVGRDVTLTGRTVLWQAVLGQCRIHPIGGYGLATFWGTGAAFPVYAITHWVPTSSHNGFLECLLELGGIGLLLLVTLFFLAFQNAARIITSHETFESSKAWIYCLLAISILNMVGDITGIINSISWLLLVCGACALEETARNRATAPTEFSATGVGMRVARHAKAQGLLNT